MSSLEEYISRELGADTYCILADDDHIAIFINCGEKDLNYKLAIYEKALNFCNHFKKLKFNYPVILDKNSFPKIEISGKISRAQFDKYKNFAGRQHFNFKLRERSKEELLSDIINRYLVNCEVKRLDKDLISIDVSKEYFFDMTLITTFFDIVSFNDEKGEIVLRFNNNYIFDISSTNLLLEYSDLAKM